MPQIDSEGDCTGRALRGTIGKPQHPENERRNCKARDPWMVTEPESAGPKARRLKAGHGLLQMPQAAVKITLQGDTRAQHEMTVDSHARIVLSLGQEKDFAPDLCSLLKLGPIVVEAGQSAKDGKKLGDFRVAPRTPPVRGRTHPPLRACSRELPSAPGRGSFVA